MNQDTIIKTINSLFGNLFSSIDSTIYSALDDVSFIDTDILNSYYFEKILGTNATNGFLLIANSLLIGFVLYYSINSLLFSLGILQEKIQTPSQFFFKILIGGILMNCSFFICEQIIYFNSLFSSTIREIGHDFLGINISFSQLIEQLNKIINIETNSNSIFSIDGILKLVFSFSFFNIIFSYSVRYIMIKVFILISPLSFLTLSIPTTSVFFKSWLKGFLALLFVELLTSIVLIIMFAISYSSGDITSKILLIGSIFALIKSNSYVREFLGGISTEVSDNFLMLKALVR